MPALRSGVVQPLPRAPSSGSHRLSLGAPLSLSHRTQTGLGFNRRQRQQPARHVAARSSGELTLLAQDVLYFLGASVVVLPVFRALKVSPVLGFLLSGFVLNQLG
jgi:hypothetical protein